MEKNSQQTIGKHADSQQVIFLINAMSMNHHETIVKLQQNGDISVIRTFFRFLRVAFQFMSIISVSPQMQS